jgi:predicted transcriptional regulator of viral defense system
MNQIEAFRQLGGLGVASFGTRDAAARLQVTPGNAHMILSRLEREGLLTHLRRGRWGLKDAISAFALPEALSAPEPAYVSLQSALFHHGLIDQVPAVTYAMTTGRTRRMSTPVGTVSFHRLPPELFSGFKVEGDDGFKMATAEKALFDVLYLAPGRSRLFARLPELDIPRGFHWPHLHSYVKQVNSPSRRTFLSTRITALEERPRKTKEVKRKARR